MLNRDMSDFEARAVKFYKVYGCQCALRRFRQGMGPRTTSGGTACRLGPPTSIRLFTVRTLR